MKLKILILALVLPAFSFAQNVGIGTTNPSAALDVVGNVEINGGLDLSGSASSNLTSTNGDITLKAGGTTLVIKSNGDIEINANGNVEISATGNIDLNGTNINLNATNTVSIDGTIIDVDALGTTSIEGSILQLNGGSLPAARLTDQVIGGTIATGSSTVFIGG